MCYSDTTPAAALIAHQHARGVYQHHLISGTQSLSGSTLRGRAARYVGRYRRSAASLVDRMGYDHRLEVSEERRDRRRVLVLRLSDLWSQTTYRRGGRVYTAHRCEGELIIESDGRVLRAAGADAIALSWALERQSIPAEAYASVRSAEVRRLAAEVLPAETLLGDEIARDQYGVLHAALAGECRIVVVTCPSTGRVYHLRVPSTCATPHEAVAWSFGETADTYAPTQQA